MQARYCSQSLTAMPSCCSTWQQTMRRSRSLAIYRRTDSPMCRAMLLLLYYNDSIIIMIQLYTLYYDSTIMTASLSWYSFDNSTSRCLFQSPGMFAQHPSYHGDSRSTRGLQCMFAQHQSYRVMFVCTALKRTHSSAVSHQPCQPCIHRYISCHDDTSCASRGVFATTYAANELKQLSRSSNRVSTSTATWQKSTCAGHQFKWNQAAQ